MLYQMHEWQYAALAPMRVMAEATRVTFQSPLLPVAYTRAGRTIAAGAELFERTTRRFEKPVFGLPETIIDGVTVPVSEDIVDLSPFCHLRRFVRHVDRHDPRVLLVAPMSGHHSTLLRGTVAALLPHHDVYVTDWVDARQVPVALGRFDLNDYIDQIITYLRMLGPDTHVIAVCQPAVPVLAAVAVMAAEDDPAQPASMTLMGGPIDPEAAPTAVTKLGDSRTIGWFDRAMTSRVPFIYPGATRRVYPGFMQLGSFMSMNLDRHFSAHVDFFKHLVRGDGESAESHRTFYDEYMSVMDVTAEFYLQTVEEVFQRQTLPRGTMMHRDRLVDPGKIRHTALLTIEGELDDISAPGQTIAAHRLTPNLPADRHFHHLQAKTGHYGIFNGRRWREQIMPRVRAFIRQFDSAELSAAPALDIAMVPHQTGSANTPYQAPRLVASR